MHGLWPGQELSAHSTDLVQIGYALPVRELLSFPNPVNEKAARVVAGVVLATVIVVLATSWYWLLVPLAFGSGHGS